MNSYTIPCQLCGVPTPMLGTKLCDRCWELERRMKNDPVLTLRVLRQTLDSKHAACVEALRLILPMAKGYANSHDVGNNWQFVEQAEAALALASNPE